MVLVVLGDHCGWGEEGDFGAMSLTAANETDRRQVVLAHQGEDTHED